MRNPEKISSEKDFRSFLRATCVDMIRSEERQIHLITKYKKQNRFPFDFHNLSFRESDTTILTIRDLYRRVAGEDL